MSLTGAKKKFKKKRNIVATVNLDCRLDLKTIALHARNAEYNPKVLPLCSLRCWHFWLIVKPLSLFFFPGPLQSSVLPL